MSVHLVRGARGPLVGAVTAALLLGGAVGASADPISPETGLIDLDRPLDGVGSDTTQDLNNALAAVVVNDAGELILGSWDATSSPVIKTRVGGQFFDRPNGPGEGVWALRAAKTGGQWHGAPLTSADISFARSSSGAIYVASGIYSYVPLAVDAVTYASGAGSHVPDGLTRADLAAIYVAEDGDEVTTGNGQTYTIGTETNPDADIVPLLPVGAQPGVVGSRSDATVFLGQLGLTDDWVGSAVSYTYAAGSVQANDGSALDAVDGAIMPFSIAQHISQGQAAELSNRYGVEVRDRRHGAVLHSMTNTNGVVVSPIRPDGTLNTEFLMTYPVFTVMLRSEIAANTNLEHAFVGGEGAVYWATSAVGSTTIEDFGFGSLINRATEINGFVINGVLYRAGDADSFRANY